MKEVREVEEFYKSSITSPLLWPMHFIQGHMSPHLG